MGCRKITVAHRYAPYLAYKVSYQTARSCLQQLWFAPHSIIERPISAFDSYTTWAIKHLYVFNDIGILKGRLLFVGSKYNSRVSVTKRRDTRF